MSPLRAPLQPLPRMRPGRAMSALHGSELGAQACGVDPVAVKVSAFTLSAALAGLERFAERRLA